MSDHKRKQRRRRALRAARAVTLGAAMAALPACYSDSGLGDDAGTGRRDSGTTTDSGSMMQDSGTSADSGVMAMDSGSMLDAGVVADAGCEIGNITTQDCCESFGFFWSDGTCIMAVPGPFTPPDVPA